MKWGFLILILCVLPTTAQPTLQPDIEIGHLYAWDLEEGGQMYHNGSLSYATQSRSVLYQVKVTAITENDVEYDLISDNIDDLAARYTCIGDLFISPEWDFWTNTSEELCNLDDTGFNMTVTHDVDSQRFYFNYLLETNTGILEISHNLEYFEGGILQRSIYQATSMDMDRNEMHISYTDLKYAFENTESQSLTLLSNVPIVIGLVMLVQWRRK